jgi:hypothetical protein
VSEAALELSKSLPCWACSAQFEAMVYEEPCSIMVSYSYAAELRLHIFGQKIGVEVHIPRHSSRNPSSG